MEDAKAAERHLCCEPGCETEIRPEHTRCTKHHREYLEAQGRRRPNRGRPAPKPIAPAVRERQEAERNLRKMLLTKAQAMRGNEPLAITDFDEKGRPYCDFALTAAMRGRVTVVKDNADDAQVIVLFNGVSYTLMDDERAKRLAQSKAHARRVAALAREANRAKLTPEERAKKQAGKNKSGGGKKGR